MRKFVFIKYLLYFSIQYWNASSYEWPYPLWLDEELDLENCPLLLGLQLNIGFSIIWCYKYNSIYMQKLYLLHHLFGLIVKYFVCKHKSIFSKVTDNYKYFPFKQVISISYICNTAQVWSCENFYRLKQKGTYCNTLTCTYILQCSV